MITGTIRKSNKLERTAFRNVAETSRLNLSNEQKQTAKRLNQHKVDTKNKNAKDSQIVLTKRNQLSVNATSKSKQLSSSTSVKKKDKTDIKKKDSPYVLKRENTRTIIKTQDQIEESAVVKYNIAERKTENDESHTEQYCEDSLLGTERSIDYEEYDYKDDFEVRSS